MVLVLITKIGSNWQNVLSDILHEIWSILCMAVGGYNDLLDNTKSRHSVCLDDLIIDRSKILIDNTVLLYQRNFSLKVTTYKPPSQKQ